MRSETDSDSLKRYLQINTSNAVQKDFYVYSKLMLAELLRENYIGQLDGIMNWYPETTLRPYILFKKFMYYLNEAEDTVQAEGISDQMGLNYPDNILTKETKHLLGGNKTLRKAGQDLITVPKEYKLYNNYPNPFNPVTKIKYSMKGRGEVSLIVYDILGREIRKLVDGVKEAGEYEVEFSSENGLPSGIYLCRMKTKDYVKTIKMLLLK